MNEEMATRLSQDLLDAPDEDARARVVVRWLPDFARCQITTAGRVKQLVPKVDTLSAKVDTLSAKMDAYHGAQGKPAADPEAATPAAATPAPRGPVGRLSALLALLKANWQWLLLFALVAKAYGLVDIIAQLLSLGGAQ